MCSPTTSTPWCCARCRPPAGTSRSRSRWSTSPTSATAKSPSSGAQQPTHRRASTSGPNGQPSHGRSGAGRMPAITWPPGWQPGYQVQQGTLTGILASDEAGDRCTGVEPTSRLRSCAPRSVESLFDGRGLRPASQSERDHRTLPGVPSPAGPPIDRPWRCPRSLEQALRLYLRAHRMVHRAATRLAPTPELSLLYLLPAPLHVVSEIGVLPYGQQLLPFQHMRHRKTGHKDSVHLVV